MLCTCTRSYVRAQYWLQILCSRDVKCNTEESPLLSLSVGSSKSLLYTHFNVQLTMLKPNCLLEILSSRCTKRYQYMTRAEKGLKWLKTFSWGDSSHLHHSSFLCIIYGALVHAHIENMADMPWYCELCQLKNAIAHQRAQEPHLFSCHYNQLIIIFGEKRVIYCWKLNK